MTVPFEHREADGYAAVAASVAARLPGFGGATVLEVTPMAGGGNVVRFQLDNGLEVLLESDHSAPLVSFQTWFRVGTVNEGRFTNGIAHLFEHLMFKGTSRFKPQEFDRLLEEAGAQNNAATWLDWTFYYENLPSPALELAFDLESDRMRNIILDAEQLESERDVVRSERRYRVDNDPDGQIEEALFVRLFPGHPYGRPTLGTFDAIDSITLGECLEFYRVYYQPSNAVLVIVGDCSFEKAVELCLTRYGSIESVPLPDEAGPEFVEPSGGITEIDVDVNSERLRIGWLTVPAGSHDAVALDVANEVLFSNESSRVFRKLIDDLPIASDVDGTSEPMRLAGTFIVDVTVNEGEKAGDAISVVFEEIKRLAQDGPSTEEMRRACNHLEASFLRSMVTVGSRATQLGIWHVTTGDYRQLFSFVEDVRRIDADAVRAAVSRYLVPSRAVSIVARPLNPAPEIRSAAPAGGRS